jgi:ABC-type uncharacterized transport system permease subunit
MAVDWMTDLPDWLIPHHAAILAKLDTILSNQERLLTMGTTISTDLTALQAAVANDATIEASAITLLNGLSAQLATALAAAQAAGATPAQVQGFADLVTALGTNSTALAAAVTANTPAATPPATPTP